MVAAKILIVEDEVLIAREIENTLIRLGYVVSGLATTAEEAIDAIVQSAPDLILMDIVLPGEIDGIEIARQVQEGFQIPVIYLTAYADPEKLQRAKATEPFGYVVKPYRDENLHAAIEVAFTRHQAETRKLRDLRDRISLTFPHEFNTPLHGIMLTTQLLMKKYNTLSQERLLQYLEIIRSNATRLHRTSQNFLYYTNLKLATTDAAAAQELTSGQMAAIKPFIQAFALQKAEEFVRSSDLELNIEEAALTISVVNLRKIVEEILDNAFKFSPQGSAVKVTGLLQGKMYNLEIANLGRGFTPEQLSGQGAYIQHERSRYEQQGLGLGLFIVQSLVELHGGSFKIESEPSGLTIVRVSLPA